MKLPKNEERIETYLKEGVECFVITQNTLNKRFTLFKTIAKNEYEKIASSNTPVKLIKIITEEKE